MNTDTRPVLLLVLANTCGGCIKFKKTILPYLESDLQRENKVRIYKVDMPNMVRQDIPQHLSKNGIPDRMISEIIPYLEWFPNCLLVSGPSWNRGAGLEISSFNGMKSKATGGWEGNPAVPVTKDNLLKWINSSVSTQSSIPLGTLTQSGFPQGSSMGPSMGSSMGSALGSSMGPSQGTATSYVPTVGSINIVPRRF